MVEADNHAAHYEKVGRQDASRKKVVRHEPRDDTPGLEFLGDIYESEFLTSMSLGKVEGAERIR